jgi:hypothetical protein
LRRGRHASFNQCSRGPTLARAFTGFDGPTALLAYAESQVAAGLLMERLQPHVGAFLQLLGNGYTVDQALSRHDVPPEAFYVEWRRRIGVRDRSR